MEETAATAVGRRFEGEQAWPVHPGRHFSSAAACPASHQIEPLQPNQTPQPKPSTLYHTDPAGFDSQCRVLRKHHYRLWPRLRTLRGVESARGPCSGLATLQDLPGNDTVTSRERVSLALAHKEPDRAPIDYWASAEITMATRV